MVTCDVYGKPFQLTFVRPGQMMLFSNIMCDPALGQATVIPSHQQIVCGIFYEEVTKAVTLRH